MLYDSLKQSVSDYKEIKKKQEKPGDSLLFRWKLATIGLSIVLIALIGVLSQQYKTY